MSDLNNGVHGQEAGHRQEAACVKSAAATSVGELPRRPFPSRNGKPEGAYANAPDECHGRRVLVVESDQVAQNDLSRKLIRQGYSAVGASNGQQALAMQYDADLILLDLDLPDLDGIEICRCVRSASEVPIIVVTDRTSELDCVLGLKAGADDYIRKPYGLQELVARIEVVMRRARSVDRAFATVLEVGPLRIDSSTREVVMGGRRVSTTRKEFELLYMLAEETGNVVSRESILHRVWGNSWSRRTVDTHVSSLRGKLGDGIWIVAVRGVGFKLMLSR
ncbi:response regulator transcription factor [Streptomyces rimosus]|uniref:response regulator transcription factor n=1 Tax=Streptomyces rimosus TaxID=1927 RepID=UPI0031D596E8